MALSAKQMPLPVFPPDLNDGCVLLYGITHVLFLLELLQVTFKLELVLISWLLIGQFDQQELSLLLGIGHCLDVVA